MPNRLLIRGLIGIGSKWDAAPVLELRSGFPWSAVDEFQDFVGPRSRADRLPAVTTFDIAVTRPFRFKKLHVPRRLSAPSTCSAPPPIATSRATRPPPTSAASSTPSNAPSASSSARSDRPGDRRGWRRGGLGLPCSMLVRVTLALFLVTLLHQSAATPGHAGHAGHAGHSGHACRACHACRGVRPRTTGPGASWISGACRTIYARAALTTPLPLRASPPRAIGCGRWISGASAASARWRRTSGRQYVESDRMARAVLFRGNLYREWLGVCVRRQAHRRGRSWRASTPTSNSRSGSQSCCPKSSGCSATVRHAGRRPTSFASGIMG